MPKKDCFGVLNKVFPLGKEGLREPGLYCTSCKDRKECLQKALTTDEGLSFRSEMLDRIPAKGFVERIKRWSNRKDLDRQKRKN